VGERLNVCLLERTQGRLLAQPGYVCRMAGDCDGDGVADFEIQFTGNVTLSAANFVL
jgi:hypothetical protein